MNIQFITAPLIGGVIGLVTNGIAIRMLFRPLKAVYIGKHKLPFTPGLIPKERPRLATAVGDVISNDLLDSDTLMSTLLSESIKEQIFLRIDKLIDTNKNSDETAQTILRRFFSEDVIKEKLDGSKEAVALALSNKVIEQNIGRLVTDYVCEELTIKAKPLLKSLTKSALNSVKMPLENTINSMVQEKSTPLIEKFLDSQAEDLLNKPIKDIIEMYLDKVPTLKQYLWKAYEGIILNKLSAALATVDISKIVSDKINELDLLELEKIIMDLMKKELNALVWLGGLLGLTMGFLNVILDML